MKEIAFINARNDSFHYNAKYATEAYLMDSQLVIKCRLLVNPDYDFTSTHLTISINNNGNDILNYSVLVTYKIDGWGQFIAKINDKDILGTPEVRQMVNMSVGFVRGALYMCEKGTPVENINLPIVNIDDIVKTVKVIWPAKN